MAKSRGTKMHVPIARMDISSYIILTATRSKNLDNREDQGKR